jgi:hypothetical protein
MHERAVQSLAPASRIPSLRREKGSLGSNCALLRRRPRSTNHLSIARIPAPTSQRTATASQPAHLHVPGLRKVTAPATSPAPPILCPTAALAQCRAGEEACPPQPQAAAAGLVGGPFFLCRHRPALPASGECIPPPGRQGGVPWGVGSRSRSVSPHRRPVFRGVLGCGEARARFPQLGLPIGGVLLLI